jgi:hypothetical protein
MNPRKEDDASPSRKSSGRAVVLVEEAAEHVDALDSADGRQRGRRSDRCISLS